MEEHSNRQYLGGEIIRHAQSSHKNLGSNMHSRIANIFQSIAAKKALCLSIKPSILAVLVFAVFTTISIIVAILVVHFSLVKSNHTCEMTFKFMTKSSIVHSSQPKSIATADFNNDKKIDVAVTHYGTHAIGIFLSNPYNIFSSQQIYSTGFESHPSSIIVNDFNNDNYSDIAVANFGTNNVGLFIGYVNGTFHSQKLYSTGSFRPWFISAGDFNRDTRLDIAVVYYNTDNIGILLANSDGSFQTPTNYFTGYDSFPYSLAIADLNNNYQLDIIVCNYATDNIHIFSGHIDGTFEIQQSYTTGFKSNPSFIALADLNDDHQLDMIVAKHGNGSVGIFLAQTNGIFTEQTAYVIGEEARPQYLSVGYFDKNNYVDVVVVDSDNDQIHILLGDGRGSFSALTTYDLMIGSQPMMVAVTDFNNDNQSDIAVVNYGTNNIKMLSGYYTESSVRQVTYLIGRDSGPTAVLIYDFNNDGILDLAVNNFNGNYIVMLYGERNGSFVPREKYFTGAGSSPQYQCLADLNNDDRIDMVIVNIGSASVGVLFGNDNGTFSNITTYSTGIYSAPWSVAVGDLNNDNYLDIVSANGISNDIGVLIGHGNRSFADVTLYSTGVGSYAISVAVGDLNNDKNLDIVVALSKHFSVAIFLGDGSGTFGRFTTYSTGKFSSPFTVILAYFNKDKFLDIAVANSRSGNVGVFIGIGNGTFMKQTTYSTGINPLPSVLSVIDFNHDNYEDIVVTNSGSNEVVILSGDGNGHFEVGRRYSTGLGSGPFGIALADFNGDTNLEIAVTYWGIGSVAVLTEYDAAKFVNQSTYSIGSGPYPYSLAIGDLNNDNQSEVVVANSNADDLTLYSGFRNTSFHVQKALFVGTHSYPRYVITADFNNDQHIDIITVNSESNTLSIFIGDENVNYAQQINYSTGDGSHPNSVAMSDFNKDGPMDFVIANEGTNSIGVLLGFKYASLQDQITYSDNYNQVPQAVVVGDFNNDEHLDIAAVFAATDTLAILLGYGNGSFGSLITCSTGLSSRPTMLAVSDFNEDGQLDIVVANFGTSSIGIFFGYGNGSFILIATYSTGNLSTPVYLSTADINNDNRTDIISVDSSGNNMNVFLGYGNGSFVLMMTYSTGDSSAPYSVALGYLNDDRQLDIAICNFETSNVVIFLGDGNGSFEIYSSYSTGYQLGPKSVVIGDFNRDNKSDIVVANHNGNSISILLGYGNGSFDNVVIYSTGDNTTPRHAVVGDFNNDNLLDIALANYGTSGVVVLFGFGDGSFLLGVEYSTGAGSAPWSVAAGDFNNDTRLDIVVANSLMDNIGVLLGGKYQPFAGVTHYHTGDGSMPQSVATGDFNNDGWSDVIVANYGTDSVGLFLGNGSKGFGSMVTFSAGKFSGPCFLVVSDFNNDNKADIIVVNSKTDNFLILLGFGRGILDIEPVQYLTGKSSQPSSASVGDLNNDSILDIVIANYGANNILIFYGFGNGSFGNETSYQLGYDFAPTSVAIVDLNNDHWMDIVIACYRTNRIEILLKTC